MAIKKYKTKKGVRWGFEIQILGNRHSKSGFKTKHEAMEAEVAHRKYLKRNANGMALKALMIERYDYLEQNVTPQYFKQNIITLNRFFESVGDVLVTDITRDNVEYFLSNYKGEHAHNYALRQIRALFNHGIERGWMEHDPTKGVRFKNIDKKLKYIPSKEDMDKVINITESFDDMAFLLVLKHTLARSNEIYNLKWEDVDLNNRQITLWTRKKRGGVKTPRHLTINDTLYITLSLIEREHEYVFWNRDTGKPYTDRKKLLMGLCKTAKVRRFTLHAFRHFGASQLAMKGVSLPEIQMILGHDNVITTSKYIQSLGINKTEAINLLD